MTYSLDFRKQILKSIKEDGLSYRKAAKFYGVSTRTIQDWEVNLEPKRTRNKAPEKIANERLLKDVEDNPSDYQYERARRLGCSASGIGHALKRLGISQKKDFNASKSMSDKDN